MERLPWLCFAVGLIVVAATSHLRRTSTSPAKTGSSAALFVLTWLFVSFAGHHLCDEGGAPAFVVLTAAVGTASTPFLLLSRLWLLRLVVGLVAGAGMFLAAHLAASYHRDEITGNPRYSSGRFWHTPFTGQYPRDKAKTPRLQPKAWHSPTNSTGRPASNRALPGQ